MQAGYKNSGVLGGASSQSPDWRQLWAKTERNQGNESPGACRFHPLLCHMLDVAAVAGLVWDHCLGPHLRKRIECSLNPDARAQLAFWSGTHDLGKASPYFQKQQPEIARGSGFLFSDNDQRCPHGFVSSHLLKKFTGATVLAMITGGHHGVFPRSSDLIMGADKLGNKQWKAAQEGLLQEFSRVAGFDLHKAKSGGESTDPAMVPILAGFISVVDWIGSNQDFFPCVAECGSETSLDPTTYWTQAQEQAKNALENLGWMPAVTFANEAEFSHVFSGFMPNALQSAAIELAKQQAGPYLMLVEAPMGHGKTEAALYAADMAMCRGVARGMYVAMPTQATGNAMFKRVLDDYLKSRGHQGKLNLQLVHGDALLVQMTKELKEGELMEFSPSSIGDEGDLEAQSWFAARKRPLLSPFGVGTIDQGLLSVLQTRHWFVRLFGLSGKVVIFDEVHAYDAYMSTILERLLCWLAEVDCTVILLSATLPQVRRKALIKAYSGRNDFDDKPYPRITMAGAHHHPDTMANSSPVSAAVPKDKPTAIGLRFDQSNLPSLATTLNRHLEHGGCAAVICNTVNRSIEVYKHLKENLQDTECLLFHARTLQMWRREREAEVLRKFGKGAKQADGTYSNPDRPKRAVLVATQVVEQSLDLDFDLMVSEIAPVDLLLQRIGRLHRHPRRRPSGLELPRFIVLCDAKAVGPPPDSFGKSIEYVYDRYILLRTWLALRQRCEIVLPDEIEALVEEVYSESDVALDQEWEKALSRAKEHMKLDRSESEKAAGKLLVCEPKGPVALIEEFNTQLSDDDDPEVHKSVRAATREGDPSITVVALPSNRIEPFDPDRPEILELLDRSAKLSHRGLFHHLLTMRSPKEWAKNAHLRHVRRLRLDRHSQTQVGDYMVTVDELLGIVIEKVERAK